MASVAKLTLLQLPQDLFLKVHQLLDQCTPPVFLARRPGGGGHTSHKFSNGCDGRSDQFVLYRRG
jgi:hypothetical protein